MESSPFGNQLNVGWWMRVNQVGIRKRGVGIFPKGKWRRVLVVKVEKRVVKIENWRRES